ncbi:MAG: hypothetical protein IPI44_15120 [Sulfuritalea sp.]|nr:hypothetical protein [Sulfuritalea sp.]
MERHVPYHGGFIDKCIGDANMGCFPIRRTRHYAVVWLCWSGLAHNAGRQRAGYRPIKIGIGINTGIVIPGTVGAPHAWMER